MTLIVTVTQLELSGSASEATLIHALSISAGGPLLHGRYPVPIRALRAATPTVPPPTTLPSLHS